MKNKNIILLSLLCLPLVACNNNEEKPSYVPGTDIRVTFHLNGGHLIINNQEVLSDVSIKVNDDFFYLSLMFHKQILNHSYLSPS